MFSSAWPTYLLSTSGPFTTWVCLSVVVLCCCHSTAKHSTPLNMPLSGEVELWRQIWLCANKSGSLHSAGKSNEPHIPFTHTATASNTHTYTCLCVLHSCYLSRNTHHPQHALTPTQLRTFGSLPLSIFPIWRAISVLPVPGGPNSSMPCLQFDEKRSTG